MTKPKPHWLTESLKYKKPTMLPLKNKKSFPGQTYFPGIDPPVENKRKMTKKKQ